MSHKYKIVTTWDEIRQVVEWTKQTKYCSLDFETSGGPFANKLEYPTIIGISFQIGSAYVIPLGHKESVFKKSYVKILKYLSKELFMNPDIIKIAWNMKFEHKWLKRYGCDFRGRCYDAMLAKYCLNEERPNDLGSVVGTLLPEFSDYKDDTEQLASKHGWANIPLKELSDRNALDCDLTLRVMVYFEEKLIKNDLYTLFRNLIMQSSIVLAESEFLGMPIDVPYLDALIERFKKEIDENELKLRSHKKIRIFEKSKRRRATKELIEKTKLEIEEIEESGKPNAARLVKAREEKISKYLAGEFTNNKERKILEPFNFNSPPQLIDLFFRDKKGFKFPILKYTTDKFKRETNNPSTDEETLEKLKSKDKSGFLEQLLTHRGLSKLYSTYMVGTRKIITEDGRVHANFKIHGTVTGRLSCSDPNLQNIPRDTTSSDIKKMFIAPKDKIILQIDYSQAELRVIAEVANEKSMLEWFRTGKDIHLASACKKYNFDYDKAKKILDDNKHKDYELWKIRRKQAKTINFGIVYCQTAKKLAVTLSEPAKDGRPAINVSVDEAQEFLNQFNRDFPAIIRFMKTQRTKAKKDGYVKTLFGRKRRLPNIYSSEFGIRAEAERQAVNAPIQGTASDFALFSSVLIREYVIKNKKHHWELEQLYTVHDSLGYSINPKYVHEAVPVINGICENPQTQRWFGFKMNKVKMGVDFEISKSWGTLRKYNPKEDYTKQV